MINYEPLWSTLEKKGITSGQLVTQLHFSGGQLSRMRNGYYIHTRTIDKLCKLLDCKIEDIIKYEKGE